MAIDRLTALDRFMLGASRRWPQDIGALLLLDGDRLFDAGESLRLDMLTEAIDRRLSVAPRFRQVVFSPRRGLGGPLWVDAESFDIADHVRELPLERRAGDDALLTAVERLIDQPLDPSRSPWEMWFITGLPRHQVGLFVRIHHAMADGMAAMATLLGFLDRQPDAMPPPARPWLPRRRPSDRRLLADAVARRARSLRGVLATLAHPVAALRRFTAAWPAIRELLAERPATRTSLDRIVGQGRRLATIGADLDQVRRIGRAHGATVNDVLLALTAGGLRRLLLSRGEPVEATTLRIYVPVSLRRHVRGSQQGNLIAQMAVPLDLGEPDPGRRLRRIAAETTTRKARRRTSLGSVMVGGRLGRQLMIAAVLRQRINATSASLPGPTRPLYLAGARLLEVHPVLPLVANEPLGVGAVSYAGRLGIGITADRDAFPDFATFVSGVTQELEVLGTIAETASSSGRTIARETAISSQPPAADRTTRLTALGPTGTPAQRVTHR